MKISRVLQEIITQMDFLTDFPPLTSAYSSPAGTPRSTGWHNSTLLSQDPTSHSDDSSDGFMMLLSDALKADSIDEIVNPSPIKKRRKAAPSFSSDVFSATALSTFKPHDSINEKKKKSMKTQASTVAVVQPTDGSSSSGGESVQSTGSRSGRTGKKRSIEETKASHRAIERRRTRRLNDLIQKIKSEVVSEGMQCRKDKASILQAAIECIHNLRSKAAKLSRKLDVSKMREKAYFRFQKARMDGVVLDSDFSVLSSV